MGEWIEIIVFASKDIALVSRLSWASGLKLLHSFVIPANLDVSPFMGEWIEIINKTTADEFVESRLSWASGLKSSWSNPDYQGPTSRLSWASGLKYTMSIKAILMDWVSPFMGEWIEIRG